MALADYTNRIDSFFSRNGDFYKAHKLASAVLMEMANDKTLFHEIIKKNLKKKDFINSKRINPVLAFEISASSNYSFIAHTWIPRPDGNAAITHQSVHHHGGLLLSSVAPIGPGYTSVLFRKGFNIESDRTTNMKIDRYYANEKGSLEFIDTFTPHVVFY